MTGGLAAPAIAALLAPLGIGGLLAGGAAPVVLGTLFGVGGGGLAGRRVRERWRGVEEFGFVEVGAGTKATLEEVDDLKVARERYQARKKKGEAQAQAEADGHEQGHEAEPKSVGDGEEKSEQDVTAEVEKDRMELEEKLLGLSLDTPHSQTSGSPRQSLDQAPAEKDIAQTNKPPSLTVRSFFPALLTACPSVDTCVVGHHRRPRPANGQQDRSHHRLAGHLRTIPGRSHTRHPASGGGREAEGGESHSGRLERRPGCISPTLRDGRYAQVWS